jgi:hypothetical protein
MLDFINSIFSEYRDILVMIGIISGLVSVVSLVATPFLLGKIPVDYFTQRHQCKNDCHFVVTTIKNLIGLVLLLAGIIMLVTPGQGIISIVKVTGPSLLNDTCISAPKTPLATVAWVSLMLLKK